MISKESRVFWMNKAKDCIDCESRGSGLVQNFAWPCLDILIELFYLCQECETKR